MREIPDYQTLMLPVLKALADGKEHHIRELIKSLTETFKLTEEELSQKTASGTPLFDNRVGWAKAYLKQAALLEQTRRGFCRITKSGQDLLASGISKIDVKLLTTFKPFMDAREREKLQHFSENKTDSYLTNTFDRSDTNINDDSLLQTQTPEDLIENAFSEYQKSLADDLLERIRNVTPSYFEKLVVELLVKMGYGGSIADAGKAIGRTGDEGIDGIIKEDKLGLDVIYIQAKRWKEGNVIGRPEVQKFVGALAGQGAKKGVFITTSSFTREAMEYKPMNETKLVLIDGITLANLMIEHNLGVSTLQTYELKKIDNDYFEEGESF